MSPLTGGLVTAVVVLAVAAALGRAIRAGEPSSDGAAVAPPADRRRIAVAAVIGVGVLFVTRWPMLAVAGAVLAANAERLVRDRVTERGIHHLEALAAWLEELRDLLRASSMGVEEALERSLGRAASPLGEPARRYVDARRRGARIDEALEVLGAAMGHPLGVAAAAALRLVVRGGAGGARLHPTMVTLAEAARDEITARRRAAQVRDVYRASMKRLIAIVVVLVGYLRLAADTLLAPYGTAAGQIVLAVPLLMWAGCIAWLDRLCRQGSIAAPESGVSMPAPPTRATAVVLR